MAISLVQTGSGLSGSGTSVTGTWTSATTTGNLLVAVVGTGAFASSLTAPSGWHSAVQKVNGSVYITACFYNFNSTSQNSQAFTVPSGAASVVLAEYSGFGVVDPLDTTGSSASFGTTASASATATTQAVELWVFGVDVQGNSVTFGTPASSFVKEKTSISSSGSTSTMLADKIVAATGTPSSSVTVTSNNWTGLMASFKGSAGGGATSSGSNFLLMGVG